MISLGNILINFCVCEGSGDNYIFVAIRYIV
uniref:Uncharacterized protein n=1 Tax=CrAss-like virus sp. ctDAq1 TaxID=2826822 RepID=A0A8S5QU13_9CAUD|nr:MAG TPA: hypothetical protein [CrAss-like virus sp. ctDAq1]